MTLNDAQGHLHQYQIAQFNNIYNFSKFGPTQFMNIQIQANIFFYVFTKTALISLDYINLSENYCQDVQIELLQHHDKFHPHGLTSVQENEANMFCSVLTLTPSQGHEH